MEVDEKIIENVFDYSNVIPTKDSVFALIKYCEQIYNNLVQIMNNEEERNMKLKDDYKEYKYKNSGTSFEIHVNSDNYAGSYSNYYCKNLEMLENLYKEGKLPFVTNLTISMELSFRRGRGYLNYSVQRHEHIFKIVFKPYNISFTRNSNVDDEEIRIIENNINNVFSKFNTVNTIFYSKDDDINV
jgi:hypothetical protein